MLNGKATIVFLTVGLKGEIPSITNLATTTGKKRINKRFDK